MQTKPLRRAPRTNDVHALRYSLEQGSDFVLAAWLATNTSRNKRSSQVGALDEHHVGSLLEQLTEEDVSRFFDSVHPDAVAKFGVSLSPERFAGLLKRSAPYVVADVLRCVSPAEREQLLGAFDPDLREALDGLLRWDPESAGGNMTPSYLALESTTRAEDAIILLRDQAKGVEAATYVYLIDEEGRLTGVVSFRGIVTADPRTRLGDFSEAVLQTVDPTMDQEEAANILNDYDLTALPVTFDGFLLGVITADRAAEIVDLETTEDFRRMGSAGGLTTSLKDASIWLLYRSRVVWLVVLVFGNIFSGAGIAFYENLIESVVALVFFLPLLIDSGGNAGSQSATLMVRGLATGDVVMRDWIRMLAKEVVVATLIGLTMAVAVSSLGFWRGGPEVALVVCLTMVLVVIFGSVVGMSLPFLLSKLGLDPASASAPLITSIVDGFGVLIYFFIASQILL